MVVKHSLAFVVVFFMAFAVAFTVSGQIQAQQDQSTQDQAAPEKAANDDEAQFAAGVAAYHAEDYQKAFDAWSPLAKGGDNAAQFNLGILYQYGLGVPRNVGEAVKWYMQSSEAGYADASLQLGDIYAGGVFGEPDDSAAVIWYEKAKAQGHLGAETKLTAARARMIPLVPEGSVNGTNTQ